MCINEIKYDIIRSVDEVLNYYQSWINLLNNDRFQSFWQHPDFILSEAQYRACELFVVRFYSGEVTLGLLPCLIYSKKWKIKFSVKTLFSLRERQLRIFGHDFIYDKRIEGRIEGILEKFKEIYFQFLEKSDRIVFENLADSGYLYACFSRFIQNGYLKKEKIYTVDFSEDFERYFLKFSKKRKYNFRRERRVLESASGGNISLDVVKKSDQVELFLNEVQQIFNNSWQGRKIFECRNDANTLAYFKEIANKNMLRSYVLRSEKGSLAFIIGYQYGKTFYYEETAYNLNWKRYFPGSVLTLMMIEDLFDRNTPKTLNFGSGFNEYKQTFGNSTTDMVSGYVVDGFNLFAIISKFQNVLDKIYTVTRTWVYKYSLEKKLKRFLK